MTPAKAKKPLTTEEIDQLPQAEALEYVTRETVLERDARVAADWAA